MSNDNFELNKQVSTLLKLSHDCVLPLVLKSALELNVIAIVSKSTSDGSYLSPSEIASWIPTRNPDAPLMLDRMLRLLASYDVVKCKVSSNDNGGGVERSYSAGPMCKLLVGNEEAGSPGGLFLMLNDEVFMKGWYHLNDSILIGGTAFNRANGMPAFEYLGSDQRLNSMFNHGLGSYTKFFMNKLLEVYRGFDGFKVLVDVGGGSGVSLNAIISKNPHIKGINYDLPHVIADAPLYPGVEHVGGDMFASVPKADVIMLKSVLHDWGDEFCVKVLKNCYEALPSDGKLVVIDWEAPEVPVNDISSHIVLAQDLFMLAHHSGGKERTLKEVEALALKSGFARFKALNLILHKRIMELHKTA